MALTIALIAAVGILIAVVTWGSWVGETIARYPRTTLMTVAGIFLCATTYILLAPGDPRSDAAHINATIGNEN